MIRTITAAFVAAFLCLPASAQTPVVTRPHGVTNTNGSGTIAVTNTFQSVFAQTQSSFGNSVLRGGCMVQNNSAANPMYVYFGPIGSATLATSVKLKAGDSVTCAVGGSVLRDQVSVTGTAGDAFYAGLQ